MWNPFLLLHGLLMSDNTKYLSNQAIYKTLAHGSI